MKILKKFVFLIFLFIFIFSNCIINVKSEENEIELGSIEITNTKFTIDSSSINTKINYIIDSSLNTPKLVITSLNDEVKNINDILTVSDDKSSIVFNDNTIISSANKLSGSSILISTIFLSLFSFISFSNKNRQQNNYQGLFIGLIIIFIIAINTTNSLTLSNVSIKIDIKVPSNNFKFESLTLKLGSGNSNINNLISDYLKIDSCFNQDHLITLNSVSITSELYICSSKDININNLKLNSFSGLIKLISNNNINLNFDNGYSGLVNIISDNLNIDGCNLKTVGTNSTGNCNNGDVSNLVINAKNTTITNVAITTPSPTSTSTPTSTPSTTPSSTPSSITTIQPALNFNYDKSNLVFMAQYKVTDNSIKVGSDGASSFVLTYQPYSPASHWLVSKTPPPALKVNTDYTFSFNYKLGQAGNVVSNMTISFYNPDDITDPNSGDNYFTYSSRGVPIYSKTFTGTFNNINSYVANSITFRPTVNIGLSTFAIQFNRTDQTNGIEATVFITDMKLTIPSTTVPTPTLLTKDSELVVIPKPSVSLDPQDSSTCPYLANDLVRWEDPTVWTTNGGVVPTPSTSSNIILPSGKKVLISSNSISQTDIYKKITIPVGSELIFADSNMTMNIQDMYVQGKLTIGTSKCRYNSYINIVFYGSKTTTDTIATNFGSKGIAVASTGFMSVQGKQYHNTWTKLAATVWSGEIVVNVQDDVNWEVGQKVLITTSVYKDEFQNQNEVMTIAAIQGRKIQFTSPLKYYHYAGTEYQAEIALLSRRIVFRGDDATSDPNQFGGHVIISGEAQISGVQLIKMGQTNIKGRYPLHFHLANTVKNSYITDCSVMNSYYRCYTIHGTNNVTLSRNVAFDAIGHCYYLEDGVEVDNTLSYNLAAFVHVIGTPAAGYNQYGQNFVQNVNLTQPADSAASCFYITNAWNSFIGNAASGGWSGYAFPNLPAPIGNSRSVNIVPSQYVSKEWTGNTAHSSGYFFEFASSIYVGGLLTYNDADGLLYYNSGRVSRDTYINGVKVSGNELWMRYNNTKIWLSNRGCGHWGERVEVVNYESHDSRRSASLFGEAWLSNAIINGQSGNVLSSSLEYTRQGFEFYDTYVQTILSNIIFRNFIKYNGIPNSNPQSNNVMIKNLLVSDQYKPQGISATINITSQNIATSQIIGHNVDGTGSSGFFNFVDFDGTVTGKKVPTIVGSQENWWNFDSNACSYNNDWNCYYCTKGSYEIANVQFWIDGLISRDETFDETIRVGNISLFGNSITNRRSTGVTRNAGVTGISNFGWYLYLLNGSPTYMKIWLSQVIYNNYVFLAIRYPPSTTFDISCEYKYNTLYTFNFTQETSAAKVRSGTGKTYYFDGTHLFVKLVNFAVPSTAYFGRSGAKVYDVYWEFYVHINAKNTVTSAVNGFYTNLSDVLPSDAL